MYWKFVVPCWPEYEELCWIVSPPGKVVLVLWTFGARGSACMMFVGNMFGTTVAGGGYVAVIVGMGIGTGGAAGNGNVPNGVWKPKT